MHMGMMSCCALMCASGIVGAVPLGAGRMSALLEDVDVLVVGGGLAGVAAAASASDAGARVALLAERPFLGDDLCETNRLVELPAFRGSDDPLMRAMCEAPRPIVLLPPTVPFTYEADMEADSRHPDTPDRRVLRDHRLKQASNSSVQYNGDPTLTVTLADGPQALASVSLLAFQREDFKVAKVRVEARDADGAWKAVGEAVNRELDNVHANGALEIKLPLDGLVTSALRLKVMRLEGLSRVLLGEICVTSVEQAAALTNDDGRDLAPYAMTVKRALDAALLDRRIPFLYNCQAVDVLKDAAGAVAGVVVANRSGLQYVRARQVIDATAQGTVARLAGARFRTGASAATQTYRRYVLGGEGAAPEGDGVTVTRLPYDVQITGTSTGLSSRQPVWAYDFRTAVPDTTFGSLMALEQRTRDVTQPATRVESTGRLVGQPVQRLLGRGACDAVVPVAKLPLDCLRPAHVTGVVTAGAVADVCDAEARQLLALDQTLALGRRVGAETARQAMAQKAVAGELTAAHRKALPAGGEQVRVASLSHRFGEGDLAFDGMELPVIGSYDLVVVGGGTGGAPAAIGAARHGARTLLLEFLTELGGTSTVGAITRYYHGNICGFTKEMDDDLGRAPGSPADWSRIGKSEWYRREIRRAGGEIWYGAMVFGAVVRDGRVTGVAVATPFGPGVIAAKNVIDASGNSDVAAAAGAEMFDQDAELGVQGCGLSPMRSGDHYINTDYLFHDDSDVIDVWRSFVLGRERFRESADLNPIIGSRERRRIVGDAIVTPMDIFNRRTYPDTICVSASNFDSHGYTCHPLFIVRGPDSVRVFADVPFGALLPRGLEGIAVTGLAISGHRDAMPILRMQPDIQNHGYAAGVAAAFAARDGVAIRHIDVKELQRHLVAIGNLPERVLTDRDSYPLPESEVAAAVAELDDDWRCLSVVMASPKTSLPLLREACLREEMPDRRLRYAMVLAMFGDATGKDTLLAQLRATQEWDKGWNYRGMGQFGPSASPLDSLIVALARIGAKEAQPDILRLAAMLQPKSHFSHFRAVSLALQLIGDAQAAPVLKALLDQPTMTGHDQPVGSDPRTFAVMSNPDWRRTEELRELFLAVALVSCGDADGAGRAILERYARDGRGVYARHAQFVLRHADK